MPGTDTRTLELLLKAKDQASAQVDKLNGSIAKVDGSAAKSSGGLKMLGLAAGGLAIGAGAALVGILGKATSMAAAEQVNMAKLGASLKANVPGWQGNTDAIEAQIAKREDLAFSDDSLRASMAMLVAGTHDVGKAFDLQSLAMDLARLKGVDLETATTAVMKASAGSSKEVKALGLEVAAGASATEILATIQKASAGQAEAYGKTSAGAMERISIKVDDLMENVGAGLLPILDTLASFVADQLIPTLAGVVATAQRIAGELWDNGKSDLAQAVQAIGAGLRMFLGIAGDVAGFLWGDGSGPLPIALRAMGSLFSAQIGILKTIFGWLGDVIGAARDALGWLGQLNAGNHPSARPGGGAGGGKAAGGPVMAGTSYVVGEMGPELFVPSVSGTIVPNGAGGGAPVVIALQLDGREVARIVDEHLFYSLRRAAPTSGRV